MRPTTESVLRLLSPLRLQAVALALGLGLGLRVNAKDGGDSLVKALLASGQVGFSWLIEKLLREELRNVCMMHSIAAQGTARAELGALILTAHGGAPSVAPPPLFPLDGRAHTKLARGAIARVRHRQWLIDQVIPSLAPLSEVAGAPLPVTRVSLVCLDDDNAGEQIEVLWEHELGAQVIEPQTQGLRANQAGSANQHSSMILDDPKAFAAYYHAIRWGQVTASAKDVYQSPFRAGIKLLAHQMTPLRKALSIPRANLFIADDVGLGKTIEAGLIASELALRQRVDFMLIICPASVAMQWKSEMDKRFGLHFEIYSRAFVTERRRERGFSVLPFATHNRFILSYSLLRRPEYAEALSQFLGARKHKSLLIMDEAHHAAPSASLHYAVDSQTTQVIRNLAPRFENRLFLSATPHNGHSSSFSALLELLDAQRFTRGVPITNQKMLEPVMVRRLKSDLKALEGTGEFPERQLVRLEVGSAECAEVQLAGLLAKYTEVQGKLAHPKSKNARSFALINLQKRLLSSVAAFARTLAIHAKNAALPAPPSASRAEEELAPELPEDEGETVDELIADSREEAQMAAASRGSLIVDAVPEQASVRARAQSLLSQMLELAETQAERKDAKVDALLSWMREHQCPGIGIAPQKRGPKDGAWSNTRVIIFTEYTDTLRYLREALEAALTDTEGEGERIMTFTGSLSDESRQEVQRRFNSDPKSEPVRILLATDAAREGLNLQAFCADLFHFDVPWNPSRMEQRNGRIDRTLQPAPIVRCHYFYYPDRTEDRVLDALVRKVDVIARELGSLSAVVFERMDAALQKGITAATAAQLVEASETDEPSADATFEKGVAAKRNGRKVAAEELESVRTQAKLQKELAADRAALEKSKGWTDVTADGLRACVDQGLVLAGAPPLRPVAGQPGCYHVPDFAQVGLGDSWAPTLDSLRVPRAQNELLWDWRKKPILPVVFTAPASLADGQVHLHLAHPFVMRVLSRFRAQGFSAHDLSRITLVQTDRAESRVILFGRLSLFGEGATRLHDEVVAVMADWVPDDAKRHLQRYVEEREAGVLLELEGLWNKPVTMSQKRQTQMANAADADFHVLWKQLVLEADARTADAESALQERGLEEAQALTQILESQRAALSKQSQLSFGEDLAPMSEAEKRQVRLDAEHVKRRLTQLGAELATEPGQIQELYHVVRRRLSPIGLVYLGAAY